MSGTQDADKISGYIELSRRMGIKVLAPDINFSAGNFTVDNGAIRFGLSAIKTVGEVAVKNILNERKKGKFKSPAEFCGRLDIKQVPRRSMENLIKCGAFDSLEKRRTALLASLDSIMAAGTQRHRERQSKAINLFGEEELFVTNAELPDVKERSHKEILSWEKETLGFYISGHPLDEFREKFSVFKSSRELEKFAGKRIKIGGIITDVRRMMTKKGDSMARFKLEDFDGVIDAILFPKNFYDNFNAVLPDEIVVVEGRVDTSNDPLQIVAEKVTAAENYAADFWLNIPAQIDTPETFDGLRKIFEEYAGWSQVFLNRGGKWKKLDKKISDGSILREELKTLLGAENVRLY